MPYPDTAQITQRWRWIQLLLVGHESKLRIPISEKSEVLYSLAHKTMLSFVALKNTIHVKLTQA